MKPETHSIHMFSALALAWLLACCAPSGVAPRSGHTPVQATAPQLEASQDQRVSEALVNARRHLAEELARPLPVPSADDPAGFSRALKFFFSGSREDFMNRAFREAQDIGQAEEAAARIAELGLAHLSLADRLADFGDALFLPDESFLENRSLIYSMYVFAKYQRAADLTKECLAAASTSGSNSSVCAALSERLQSAPGRAAQLASAGSAADPCSVSQRIKGTLYASERARTPIAELDGSASVTVFPARARGQRYATQATIYDDTLWLDAQHGPRLVSRLPLIPGHLWLNPGARVEVLANSDATVAVLADLGKKSKQPHFTKEMACGELWAAPRQAGGLGMSTTNERQTKNGALRLHDRPDGNLVTILDQRWVGSGKTEGAWTEVYGTGEVGYSGWARSKDLRAPETRPYLAQVLSGGLGPSGNMGQRKSGFWKPLHLSMRVRLAPEGDDVLTLGANARIKVIAREESGAWIAVHGLSAHNTSKHFWLPLPQR